MTYVIVYPNGYDIVTKVLGGIVLFFIYAFLGLGMFLLGIKLMSDNFKDLVSTRFKNKINKRNSQRVSLSFFVFPNFKKLPEKRC